MAKLEPAERSETDFLQPLFDVWATRRAEPKFRSVRIGGAPDWLLKACAKNEPARNFYAYGYSVRIDVLWKLGEEWRLIELKHAWKYEPLAVPEVLHNARLFSLHQKIDRKLVRPTIIGNSNAMTRAALADLALGGMQAEHLEYLEFEHFITTGKGPVRQYLWFDDPRAPWRRLKSAPADLPPEVVEQRKCWYRIPRTNSWVGTDAEVGPDRPLMMEVPYTMATPVADVEAGSPRELLVWNGTPPALGTGAKHLWNATTELVPLGGDAPSYSTHSQTPAQH